MAIIVNYYTLFTCEIVIILSVSEELVIILPVILAELICT